MNSSLSTLQQLAARNVELEQRLLQRTFELEILSELSQRVSYPLSDKDLLCMLIESLDRVLPIEVAAGLIADPQAVQLVLHSTYPLETQVEIAVRDRLLESFCLMTGQHCQDDEAAVPIEVLNPRVSNYAPLKTLDSMLLVPMLVGRPGNPEIHEIVGMLLIGAVAEDAFTQSHLRFWDTVANQGAVSLDRLRSHLSAEKKRLEKVVTHFSEGVVLINAEGRILLQNQQAQAMLEQLADIDSHQCLQCLGDRPLSDWLHPLTHPPQWQTLSLAASSQSAFEVMVKGSSPFSGSQEYTLTIREIASKQEIERLKDELLSVISHELRTPLTLIYAPLEMLASGQLGALNQAGLEILDIALQNAQKLRSLMDKILQLSQLEAGTVEMQFEPCQAILLTEQAIAALPETTQARVTLQPPPQQHAHPHPAGNDRSSQPLTCWGDFDYLLQVFDHLLDNAVKFSDPESPIEVAVFDCGDRAQFSIRDRGVGIPNEQLVCIFDCFQQGDSSKCRTHEGLGLGLAICDRIVQQHGGELWVDSILNQGSTFHISLPKTARDLNSH